MCAPFWLQTRLLVLPPRCKVVGNWRELHPTRSKTMHGIPLRKRAWEARPFLRTSVFKGAVDRHDALHAGPAWDSSPYHFTQARNSCCARGSSTPGTPLQLLLRTRGRRRRISLPFWGFIAAGLAGTRAFILLQGHAHRHLSLLPTSSSTSSSLFSSPTLLLSSGRVAATPRCHLHLCSGRTVAPNVVPVWSSLASRRALRLR